MGTRVSVNELLPR